MQTKWDCVHSLNDTYEATLALNLCLKWGFEAGRGLPLLGSANGSPLCESSKSSVKDSD